MDYGDYGDRLLNSRIRELEGCGVVCPHKPDHDTRAGSAVIASKFDRGFCLFSEFSSITIR